MMMEKLDGCVVSVRCEYTDSKYKMADWWTDVKETPKDCRVIGIDISKCPSVDPKILDKMQYIDTKNGEFVRKRKKSDWVSVNIPITSEKQLEHLSNAESELFKAGISFDTSYDFGTNTREWQMDWALNGARIEVE